MTYPPDFTFPAQKQLTAYAVAQTIADLVPDRRAVVQAGGCAGLWPLALAHYFDHVYTFEPEPSNFQCLKANVADVPNVVACSCALGEAHKRVGMTRPKAGAGLWQVSGPGPIQMVPLDDVLGDTAIDAIVLDVEGAEVQVLRGATRVIAAHRPLLWFEFLHHVEAITAFLDAHGYAPPVQGIGGDAYSVHRSRIVH